MVRAHVGPQYFAKAASKPRDGFFVARFVGEKFMPSAGEVSPDGTTEKPLKQLILGIFLYRGQIRGQNMIFVTEPFKTQFAHLAAKLLVGDLSPIKYYEGEDVIGFTIENEAYVSLNKLKKQPDKSSFYYGCLTTQLLK